MGAVAIITARGGSKRIPRKNIKEFLGKPILAYSVEAALKAGCFDEVMVSTDDGEIAGTARKLGAAVPFMRSAETSGDYASTAAVICEVLRAYTAAGRNFKYGCCIYPTAPFVTPERLKAGYETMASSEAETLIPVVRFGYPIQRALKIEDGRLAMICPENLEKRSQDLVPAYHDAGQFYWFRTAAFLRCKRLLSDFTMAMELSESEAQDIDSEEDWKIAEMKYRILRGV